LNIDTSEIEQHITEKTVAIMPVHVFGNPCKVDEIDKIATRYNLKVIYDAAHAIGTTYNGNSVLEYGDISATSLHATKILSSAEGGGCITNDMVYNSKLEKIRFFGHNEEKDDIIMDGFNGKLTEVHAALGLVNLKYFNDVLAKRKELYNKYLTELESQPLDFHAIEEGTNFSYFPIIFKSENELLIMEKTLNENNIFPRRYFFPSVNTFTKIVAKQSCPVSEDISNRILCLPLYYKLSNSDVEKIASIIRND
jgi:dTDP-4-amino-4,6-dideoxygalactose transaminase